MKARIGGAVERFLPQGDSLISPAGRKLEELVGHHITLKQMDGTKRTGKLAAPSSTSGWSSGTVTLHDVESAVNGQRALAKKCNFHISDIDYIQCAWARVLLPVLRTSCATISRSLECCYMSIVKV